MTTHDTDRREDLVGTARGRYRSVLMRPLLIASSYAPHTGGVEEVVARVAAELAIRKHHPAVVTNQQPHSLPSAELVDGIPVTRHAFRVPHRSIRGIGGWMLGANVTRRKVITDARDHRATLINIHCVSSNAAYALAATKALGLPLIVSLHGELGNDASDVYKHDARLVRAWRRLIDRADAITAPSQFVMDEAQQFHGSEFGGRASVIRNGVDLDLFGGERKAEKRPFAFAVGRLVRPKGFDVLIDAWARLPESEAIDLVIGGDGPQRGDLEHRAAATGRRVRLVGRLSRAEVADHLARASLFVLPSHAEPLGLTVLEAMAARTPVVATAAGGVPELIEHGVSGMLVPPGDRDAIADAVLGTLADTAAGAVRAVAAVQFVSTLTWSACTDAYVAAYRAASE